MAKNGKMKRYRVCSKLGSWSDVEATGFVVDDGGTVEFYGLDLMTAVAAFHQPDSVTERDGD